MRNDHPSSYPPLVLRSPSAHLPAAAAKFRRDSEFAFQSLVAREDLSVVYQPIVHMESRKLFAYEVLTRCKAADLSPPPVLFERAVQFACAGRLGRTIRELAVPTCPGVPLFINVHPQELIEGWLVRPDDPMFFHDHDIYLEITESVPLTHFELCFSVLSEVRSRSGVHLVVDDLGAGYSNLKRIADLEPAVVKLDRELIAGLHKSRRQQQLVVGVVRLCTDLKARVVAEGIETKDEYAALCDTGVQYGQGYWFARPAFPPPAVVA